MNFTSVSGKKWLFKKFNLDEVKKYSEIHSLSEIVSKLISIRSKNIKNVELFLNPTIKNLLPNPFQLKDMGKAVERTCAAIMKQEIFGIFGDYDVDGATSTAVLAKYLTSIKQKFKTYIPDRKKEGYGPNSNGFNKLISDGVKIILTVDCGTLSFNPINEVQKKGIDVIVLDHHQSDLKLPKAYAIINPNRFDDSSDLKYLCAAGVCFIYLVALNKMLREKNWFKENKIEEPNILNFLDLISLGTVCDVVPLIDLNRAIVKQGLKIIKNRTNLGLKTLYDLCKIESQPTTLDLSYKLGPRINAGGRVGKSYHGAELLSSNDPERTYKIATALNKSNKERQTIEALLTEQVYNEISKMHNHPVFVLSGKNWHEGIIGILASRITEKYNKPTVIISINENVSKGSARSIFGFDIGLNIIKAVQKGVLEKGGGHKMAGGFVIKEKNINIFKDFLCESFNKSKVGIDGIKSISIDSIISPSALNEDFYEDINLLAPFGAGNSEPTFVIENLKVIKSFYVGDKHIKSILSGKDGNSIKSIAFNAKNGPLESFLTQKNKKRFNVVGKMSLNEWKGIKNMEFIISDISTS